MTPIKHTLVSKIIALLISSSGCFDRTMKFTCDAVTPPASSSRSVRSSSSLVRSALCFSTYHKDTVAQPLAKQLQNRSRLNLDKIMSTDVGIPTHNEDLYMKYSHFQKNRNKIFTEKIAHNL